VNGQVSSSGSRRQVVVAAVVSLWQRLGLQRQILWSAARALVQLLLRALVQLLLVGAALTLVVEPGRSMLWSWLWVAIVAYAGDVARRRAPQVRRIMALTIASFSAAAVITSGRCWPQRLFAAGRTLVPIAGMVVGNLMTAMVLVARRLVDELREDNPPETRQTLRTRCAPRCLRRSRAPRPPDWCSCPAR
jgi:putative ABC transport system permease protein